MLHLLKAVRASSYLCIFMGQSDNTDGLSTVGKPTVPQCVLACLQCLSLALQKVSVHITLLQF
jgi:hypothetical protein